MLYQYRKVAGHNEGGQFKTYTTTTTRGGSWDVSKLSVDNTTAPAWSGWKESPPVETDGGITGSDPNPYDPALSVLPDIESEEWNSVPAFTPFVNASYSEIKPPATGSAGQYSLSGTNFPYPFTAEDPEVGTIYVDPPYGENATLSDSKVDTSPGIGNPFITWHGEKLQMRLIRPQGASTDKEISRTLLRTQTVGRQQVTDSVTLTIPVGGTASEMVEYNALVLAEPGPEDTKNTGTTLSKVEMMVDANYDGTIDESDRGKVSAKHPWSFWLNDNDDQDTDPFGSQAPDWSDGHVNGRKDLKDFFPVFLNIQQLVKELPSNQSVKYKLKQADGAVNFVETNLTREAAFLYSDSTGTGYGVSLQQHASSATTTQITPQGVELSDLFLNNIKNDNKGVILIEGRAPTDKPLVLTVEEGGVQVAEVSLPLSLAPRILLLLHGMNSNTDTWEEFVNAAFPYDASVGTNAVRSMVIRNKDFVPDLPATLPHFNRVPGSFGNRGVRCYRLQFGAPEKPSTTRTGLPGDNGIPLTTGTAKGGIDGQLIPYLSDRRVKCGDFETFDELAQEVDAAITMLLDRHPGAKIVLVGHSRGGLAGRKFLEGSSTNKDAVVGFLTTSSLHKGSQMGRIYQWLSDNPRHVFNGAGQELMEQITLTAGTQTVTYYEPVNWRDWAVVDFLCAASWPFSSYKTKDTLDVRRPVIMDMDDRSTAIATLNDPTQVANLPPKVMYGEVVYAKVDLGVLVSDPPYSAFSNSQILTSLCPTVSVAAKTYILGAGKLPDDFPGDGLIRWENQYFTKLSGFPAPGYPPAPPPATDQNTILRKYVTDRSVVHTEAPLQVDDLRAQLRLIVPSWFP